MTETKDLSINLYGDDIGRVDYISHMGDDLTVVNSARVSFGKTKKDLDAKDKKLINYLISHRHTSTLEHNCATFRFVVPLFIRSQHHRHRTWSYNEISRRYTDVDLCFYEPKEFRTQHVSNRQASNPNEMFNPLIGSKNIGGGNHADYLVRAHHKKSIRLYNSLIDSGVCREQARGVLPQNLYTEYYGTANLNNIMKFVDLRLHDGAQWEIQQVANAVLDIVQTLWPETVSAFRKLKDI